MAHSETAQPTRRDFIYVATAAATAVGGVLALWPFIDQMNPSADVLALSSIEVDLTPIAEGQQVTFVWRSKPLFVRHRTAKEIAEAQATPLTDLIDPLARNANLPDNTPATDANRLTAVDPKSPAKPQWLVLIGSCTHLGCVPQYKEGPYGGYLCHCHGSQYDTSGRVRHGPAPQNLDVPQYTYLSDTRIKVG